MLPQPQLPPLPLRHIERPRCLARLEAGAGCSLTLVLGEAGSGKTTLLAEYAHSLKRPVSWLSLTPAERDSDSFLQRLRGALQQHYPWMSTSSAERLRDPCTPDRAMALLFADLRGHADLVLVLDELEALGQDPASMAALKALLTNFPAAGQLIWSGRSLPTVPLASLRLNSRLVELKGAELAFTQEEVMTLAAQAGRESSAKSIWEKTLGWAAGVSFMLAAPTKTAARLMNPSHLLHDYLIEEILLCASPSEQEELLQASFGPHLSWQSGVAAPPLWREALQMEAHKRWDDSVRRARILELASCSRDPLQAMALQQQAAAWDEAIALIHRHSETLCTRERLGESIAVLEGFPTNLRASSAWLAYLEGKIARCEGRLDKALDFWELALTRHPPEAHPFVHLSKACAHAERGELEQMDQDCMLAQGGTEMPRLPEAEATRLRANRAYARNELESALTLGKEALRLYRLQRSKPGTRMVHDLLGLIWHAQGQFELAISHLREAEAIDEVLGCCVDPLLYDLWAQCELNLGRSGEGQRLLEKGRDLSERLGDLRAIAHHARTLGSFHLSQGETERAWALFSEARSQARAIGDPILEIRAIWGQAQVHLQANRLQEAERLMTFSSQIAGEATCPALGEGKLLMAEVLGKAGRLAAALALLAELEQPNSSPYLRFLSLRLRCAFAPETGESTTDLRTQLSALAQTHGFPDASSDMAEKKSPPSLDIRLLGAFSVKVEERLLTDRDWQSSNAKLVLAYLLFHPSGVDKENLRKLLFPAHQPARSAVHMVINRLRTALEPEERNDIVSRYILYQDGSYRLNPDLEIRCDAFDLNQAMTQARNESGESRIAALGLAATLFQGVFLKDFLGIEWCAIERERLRQLGNEAYRQLFHHWTQHAEWSKLEILADKLLAIDPWHPSGVRARLVSLAFQKRKEDALSWLRLVPCPDERTIELGKRIERNELTLKGALQELG